MSIRGLFKSAGNPQEGETGKHFLRDVTVGQAVMDVRLRLLFESRYIILKPMSLGDAKQGGGGHHVGKSVNRLC